MRIDVSEMPTDRAAHYLTEVLESHASTPILLMLSGGSVASLLPHIRTDAVGPHVTVSFVDDRFTTDPEGNNFSRFRSSLFYETIKENGANFIETTPSAGESHNDFTHKIAVQLRTYMSTYPNAYVIGVFGIGDDGHTASIFPSTQHDFIERFSTEDLYVPIYNAPGAYKQRSTVPPIFIEECIDHVILYAVGENKCNTVLVDMHNKNLQPYEVPALIPARHPESILFTDCHLLVS